MGEAIRIYTGAPIPRPADAVIMQEDVDVDERTILVREGVIQRGKYPGARRRPLRGSEGRIQRKSSDRSDDWLPSLRKVAGELPVFKRPRVAIFATGSELKSPGRTASFRRNL